MVYVNFALFFCICCYFIKKREDIVNIYPLLLWTLASFGSIYYSQSVIYRKIHDFTFVPFLYLIVLFLLFFLNVKSGSLTSVKKCNSPFLQPIIYLIAYTAYFPFIETAFHLIFSGGIDFANIADIKDEYTSGDYDPREILSAFSSKLFGFSSYSWFLSPIFFFYYIATTEIKTTKDKIILAGLIFSYLNPMLLGLTVGGRGALLWSILYFLQVFLFFRNTIPEKIKKTINIFFLAAASFIMAFFAIITINRFSSDQYSDFAITDWLWRYLGESFCNFNTECWYTKGITYGQNCFSFYTFIVGGDGLRNPIALGQITGTRMNVYNTLFGDLIYDFGHLFAIIFVLILCYISSKLRPKNGVLELPNFLLYSVCFYILLTGFLIWPLITKAYAFTGVLLVSTVLLFKKTRT